MRNTNSLDNFWNSGGNTGDGINNTVAYGTQNTPVQQVMPVKPAMQVQSVMSSPMTSASGEIYEDAHLSMGKWIATFAILSVPIVNLVMLILWAIKDINPTRKTFARAVLFWILVIITVSLVLMVIFYDTFDYAPTIQKHMKVFRYAFKTITSKF